jgi:NADH dehydrogenase FAD-containing subunit
MPAKLSVVVAGGGFAGLETAFVLKHRLHDDVDITLVSDKEKFLFRPNTIYLPFGAALADLEIPLVEPTKRQDIRLVVDRVVGVEPSSHQLELASQKLHYDRLVIATGLA